MKVGSGADNVNFYMLLSGRKEKADDNTCLTNITGQLWELQQQKLALENWSFHFPGVRKMDFQYENVMYS